MRIARRERKCTSCCSGTESSGSKSRGKHDVCEEWRVVCGEMEKLRRAFFLINLFRGPSSRDQLTQQEKNHDRGSIQHLFKYKRVPSLVTKRAIEERKIEWETKECHTRVRFCESGPKKAEKSEPRRSYASAFWIHPASTKKS